MSFLYVLRVHTLRFLPDTCPSSFLTASRLQNYKAILAAVAIVVAIVVADVSVCF